MNYKENFRNNNIIDVPLNYYNRNFIDFDEQILIKYLYDIDYNIISKKENFRNNDVIDIPLNFYHINNFDDEKYITQIYKENYIINNNKNIILKKQTIDDVEKYINYE